MIITRALPFSLDLQSNWVWPRHKMRIVYQLRPIYHQKNCHPVAAVPTRILPLLQGRFHSVNRKCSISIWNDRNIWCAHARVDANGTFYLYGTQSIQNMGIVTITWRYSSRCTALTLFDEFNNRCLVYFVYMIHQIECGDSPVNARHAEKFCHAIFLSNGDK